VSDSAGGRAWIAVVLLAAFTIGFAPIFTKLALRTGIGPIAIAGWRLGIAALVFAPFLLRARPAADASEAPAARPGPWALAIPGLCFAADLATWHLAFELTTAANATVLANLAVLVVALAGYLFLGERFDWRLPAGALLGLVGVASLIRLSLATETVGPEQWKGDLISLATAVSYAGYIISVKWLRQGYGALPILVASSAVGGALCFVLAVAHGESLIPTRSVGWLYLLGLGLVAHCVGQGLVTVSLKRLPASLVSVLLLTQPVHVAWLGALLLGEPLSLAQAGSMGLVLLAVGLAIYGRRRSATASDSPA